MEVQKVDRDKKFKEIKKAYDDYYKGLVKLGKPLVRDTKVGIWGVSISDNVYNFFKDIHLEKYDYFLDLGSGDGKVVLIASLFTKAGGIEFDKELFDASIEIRDKLGVDCSLIHDDFFKHDWSKYDVAFINPDQGFHKGVEDKLLNEFKGTLIVYNFVFEPRFLKKGKKYWYDQTPITVYTNK
tara:strand:+ start:832 stop:1380 length:549 start_codon:yes stop_codon:yes gene_type:complete